MLPLKTQRGFIQFGIIALVVLTAGLFAVTKLASNKDLTFFNIGEYAKVTDEEKCGGCVDGYRLRWNRTQQRCIRTVTASCNPITKTKPTATPKSEVAECGACTDDSQCQSGLSCLFEAVSCIPEGPCPVPNAYGSCVKLDGSSKCSPQTPYPTPTPTPPPGCKYQPVQCIKAPCPSILVCPTDIPVPTPKPSPGICSCFGNYSICDQSQDGQTDSVFRCQWGCGGPDQSVGTCNNGVQSGEIKSGELCYGDWMCQSGKCITPSVGPYKFSPPVGFDKVCQ